MKISYLTSRGVAERISFDTKERDTLTLAFEPHHEGAVLLGGRVFPLHNGEVSIPMTELTDGEYSPRLESEAGVFIAEGFNKAGRSVTPSDTEESVIRRLISRCYSLEDRLICLERRVSELEIACTGHKILDFERKEK